MKKVISAQIKTNIDNFTLTLTTDTGEVIEKIISDSLEDTWEFEEEIGDINIINDEFEGKGIYSTQVHVYPNSTLELGFIDEGNYFVQLIESNQDELNIYSDNFN